MRLAGKSAIVFGAGQTPGPRIGNGRATAQLFAREGARVLAVDRDEDSARETVETIAAAGGEAHPLRADVTREDEVKAAVQRCRELWGGIDIVHNNVGVSLAGGDAEVTEITTEAFDRVMAINLRGMVLACNVQDVILMPSSVRRRFSRLSRVLLTVCSMSGRRSSMIPSMSR